MCNTKIAPNFFKYPRDRTPEVETRKRSSVMGEVDSQRLFELQNKIISLQEQIAQGASNEDSNQVTLDRKSFPWDTFILVIATIIAGLSISDVVAEFLKPDSSKVACFVNQSNGFDRDQVQYVNEFCHRALPSSVNLTIALFVQGLLLAAPHFVWKVIVGGRIDSYFSHVANLKTLHDRKTGKYPENNFGIVEYLQRQFGGNCKRFIVVASLVKLMVQWFFMSGAIVVTATILQDSKFDVTFDCEDDGPDPLFENVTCSYSKLQYIFIVRIADYILLGLSWLVIPGGIVMSQLKFNVELENKNIAKFFYQSGIDSESYVVEFWQFIGLRCNDDLNLLLSNLFSTNAGLGKVLKSVQIESDLSDIFDSHLELPIATAAEMARSGETDETDQQAAGTRNVMLVSNV